MERVDTLHRSKQENVNILFNMIQACRIDCELIKRQNTGNEKILDTDLVNITKALLDLVKETFQTIWEYDKEER